MTFKEPLVRGILLRRYKRFLADVRFRDGTEETVHCANTGAMTGCDLPGSEVWCSRSLNPARKYRHTLEVVIVDGDPVVVNTARANEVIGEALEEGRLPPLGSYTTVVREVRSPDGCCRFDLLLRGDGVPDCFVEVKSVTWLAMDGLGLFPDARSERARKHLESLLDARGRGYRAVLIFCVQHGGIEKVAAAQQVDPAYAAALSTAVAGGVEVYAWRSRIESTGIRTGSKVPVLVAEST